MMMRQSTVLFSLCALLLVSSSPEPQDISRFRPGKDHALFFAIHDYDHWTDLKNPIRDAEAIAQQLRTNYEFDDLKIVTNPTLETIQATLNEYLTKTYSPDDQLFIFFSGHGAFNDLTAEGFFIPKAGLKNDPYQNSYLPLTRLERIISNIPCSHILLTIDACYSGTFNESIALDKSDPTNPTWRRPGVDPGNGDAKAAWITAKLAKRSRICITSGGKERTSDGIEHSPLTEAFLKGLANPGDDAILTVDELVAGLKNLQPSPKTFSFGTHQSDGSFLFIQRASNNPNLDSDLDGILDTHDECPRLYAKTPTGCPDADEDGIPDPKDKCPYESGPASNQGCPTQAADADGDGIPDAGDACPTEKGLARFAGCPDTDSDGVPDKDDNCPTQAGPTSNRGCPLAAPDRDRDGIPDTNDRCPDQPGSTSNNGCPVSIGMALVKAGTFKMGDSLDKGVKADETIHLVSLSSFFIAKNEVTFDEFDAFCKDKNLKLPDDNGWGRGKLPVINVDWYDAIMYCNWRSSKEGYQEVYIIDEKITDVNNKNQYDKKKWNVLINPRANGYRLLTESEWEYAARQGGMPLRYGNGKNFADTKEINYDGTRKQPFSNLGINRGRTIRVDTLGPNSLNLYHMSGNVWEWCQDWYGEYPKESTLNPTGPVSGRNRVCRGGSWTNSALGIRVTSRNNENSPDSKSNLIGFRVARSNL